MEAADNSSILATQQDNLSQKSNINISNVTSSNNSTTTSNNNSLLDVEIEEGTPMALALQANRHLEVTKLTKALRRVRTITAKRPKLKHLNLTKKFKKQERHFEKVFKGKVIDGQHELYILTAGMMLGMRCVIGRLR